MLWWLAQNFLIATTLAVIVTALCRLLRFRPAVRHALWFIVLVKLVTPPLIEWPWELPDIRVAVSVEPPATAEVNTTELSGQAPGTEQSATVELDVRELADANFNPGEEPVQIIEEIKPAAEIPRSIWWQSPLLSSVLLGVWFAGSCGMLVLQAVRISRFRRLIASVQPAPGWLIRPVDDLSKRLRVRRPFTLIVSGICSPFIWGLGRPKLLWPAALMDHLPAHCRRSVIAHELAHLRRRDHWVGWLLLAAECLWWWNPLFWYVRRQLRLNAELACDAWVVGMLPEDRRAYAEALIEVTELVSRTVAPAPALGISSGARQAFERRLTMIMAERVPCKVPALGLVAIGLLGLAALPGWAQVQQVQVRKADEIRKSDTKPEEVSVIIREILDEPAKTDQKPQTAERKVITIRLDDKKDMFAFLEEDGAPNRDKKLAALEQQLQALLKEVHALRQGGGKGVILRETRTHDGYKGVILNEAPLHKPYITAEAVKVTGKPIEVHLEGKAEKPFIIAQVAPHAAGQPAQLHADVKFEQPFVYKAVAPDGAGRPGQPFVIELQTTDQAPAVAGARLHLAPAQEGAKAAQGTIRYRVVGDKETQGVVNLSRATFKLPAAQAEALIGILQEIAKAHVLESKVEGDSLTVTTTPGGLKAVRQLIDLIHGKSTASVTYRLSQVHDARPQAALQLHSARLQLEGAQADQVRERTVLALKLDAKRKVDQEAKLKEIQELEKKLEILKKQLAQPRKD